MNTLNFELENTEGKRVNLQGYKGRKVLVSFYRDTACPFCNLRIHELISNYGNLRRNNIDIIAVFPSSVERIIEYSGKQQAPFELLADPDEKIYRELKVKKDKWGMLKSMLHLKRTFQVMRSGFMNKEAMKVPPTLPVDILLDEEHNIIKRYDGTFFGDHIPMGELLNWKP